MLGEKIGEGRGKIIGQRLVDAAHGIVRVETTFAGSAKILDTEFSEMATYWSEVHEGGALAGEGNGVWMSRDGERVVWRGLGAGRPTGSGKGASFRGALTFETRSERLARLNGLCGIFEFEADDDGNTHAQLWEWK